MEQNNQTPLINIQKEIREEKKAKRRKKIWRRLKRVLLFVLVVVVIYGIYRFDQSDASRISRVIIKNNTYLTDEEIIQFIDLNDGDRLVLSWSWQINSTVESHPQISESTTSINYWTGIVTINVYEAQLLAYELKSNTLNILTQQGAVLERDSDNLSLMADLPQISGYSHDELKEVASHLIRIDEGVYGAISELKKVSTSYDSMQIQLLMSDGITITSPLSGLQLLNEENYYDVINRLHENNRCIMIDPYTQTMVSSPCTNDVTEP